MKKELNCIMLVDDNPDDIYIHEKILRLHNSASEIVSKFTGKEALEYIQSKSNEPEDLPSLIFLDINMPGMNGWEFLQQYDNLPLYLKNRMNIVMLSTSEDVDDLDKARKCKEVSGFRTKPMTLEMLDDVMDKCLVKHSAQQ